MSSNTAPRSQVRRERRVALKTRPVVIRKCLGVLWGEWGQK